MDLTFSRPSQFLISISNKQYKIVKFINGDNEIKAQKIFQIELKHPDQLILLKNQLENVKDYLIRLKELPSAIQLQSGELQILQSQNQTHFVIKVNTFFCQHPTLFDFHKVQMLKQTYKLKYDEMFYIYFFEEFFQLMVKAGGIKNFFYTNHNIWIMPPNPNSILEMGKLMVNKTSIAGLKFINGFESITKQEFIEIYPSLPPNVYELMKDKSPKARAKLELIIKIRSFAFLILTFIIKRVPILFDENFKPKIDCEQPQAKKLVEKSAEKMKTFLELPPIQNEIKVVQRLTKVRLRFFFQIVFVKISEQEKLNWLWVYRIFFEKNLVNIDSFERTRLSEKEENKDYLQNKVYFQKIIYQMWQMETEKDFYIERGLVQTEPFRVNMVYFMVKINGNFHRLLRFLNLAQLMRLHRFSEDVSQIAIKLMQIFNPKLALKNEQNPSEIQKIIQQSRQQAGRTTNGQPQTGNGLTLEQQSDSNIFNPFAFKSQKQMQLASQTYPKTTLNFPSDPIQFLQNIYTYVPKTSRFPEMKGNPEMEITTMSHKLQDLINIGTSLWLV